jgi:parallel beta-helix repeat protein
MKWAIMSHDPFRINNNAEFATMAGIEGWTGNGLPGSPYIIEGYDINGSGYGYCIYIGNTTDHFMVKESYLHEANGVGSFPYFMNTGIILYNIQNGTITNNSASSNEWDGIYVRYSSNNTIANNTVSSNNEGIYLRDSSSNTITNNTVSSNKWDGIYLDHSINNSITNNNASDNDYGIYLFHSNSNTIANNNGSSNWYGILLYSSINNTITNNTAFLNKAYGILLEESRTNYVVNNNASFNDVGIFLYFADNNSVANNIASSNDGNGIYLESSSNNAITNNTILNNSDKGISLLFSYSNNIFHNIIVGNTNQAYDDTNNGNQWDNGYPSGGNFWSDYAGSDYFNGPNQDQPGSDGIGDTNYSIDSDSVDNYPLMSPGGPFIFLYPGWNLISIPFIQSDTNLEPILSSINSSYDAVQWYNIRDTSDLWKHHQISKPSHLNDFTDINHTIGFWIHITEPDGVLYAYPGIPPTSNQSIPLHPGWNIVGYPSLSNRNRTVALNNLTFGLEVDAIWTFNAATKNWVEVIGGGNFEIGRGYWIHATQECEWEVPL